MYRTSIYKGCLTVVIVLLLLIVFCLVNLEVGTAPFYMCIFSLIVDIPFLLFLLYKLVRDYQEIRKEQKGRKPDKNAQSHSSR